MTQQDPILTVPAWIVCLAAIVVLIVIGAVVTLLYLAPLS